MHIRNNLASVLQDLANMPRRARVLGDDLCYRRNIID
jgi:hypothetical protein